MMEQKEIYKKIEVKGCLFSINEDKEIKVNAVARI
jgi:hypothetical protein